MVKDRRLGNLVIEIDSGAVIKILIDDGDDDDENGVLVWDCRILVRDWAREILTCA